MSTSQPDPATTPWSDVSVVITAGPTREHLDDIRFLSNGSTGRLGIELAKRAKQLGAKVTLVLGPTPLSPPTDVTVVRVVSTNDLYVATRAACEQADIVLFAAAPSDWRPQKRRHGKPPREDGDFEITLTSTQDVAATLGRLKGARLHVGFALEIGGGEPRARAKLKKKNFDAIVLNSSQNFGLGGGDAFWIAPDGEIEPITTASKPRMAQAILARVEQLRDARSR